MAREVDRLVTRWVQARQGEGSVDLGATEFAVRGAMQQVGSVLLEQLLNADHGGHCGPRTGCGQGHQAQFIDYRRKQLLTVLGPVVVRRSYYHCAQCAAPRGVIPKDDALDIRGTSFSPGVRRLMARVGAQESFAAARQDLAELAGLVVRTKAVERVTEASGRAAETANQTERAAPRGATVQPLAAGARLYVAIDGTGVPAVPHDTRGRPGKAPDGQAHTREAKLGCVFTQTTCDAEGHPRRDPQSTTYVGAIEPALAFGPRIHVEAVRRGLTPATEVIVLGDGAPWIWNVAAEFFPSAVHIVDLYHAREHLAEIGHLVFGTASERGDRWGAARREELDNGEVEAVITALTALRPPSPTLQEAVRKAADYFATNQLRMCYRQFRRQGYFVGSGVVEAGCKTVIGHRLKQSGMRWTVAGANAVIALRCRLLSNRWEPLWSTHPCAA